MSLLTEEKARTPEALLLASQDKLYELVDGALWEKRMGGKSCWVAYKIAQLLGAFVDRQRLGYVLVEATYRCFAGQPEMIRRPDVSFLSFGRLPGEELPDGHIVTAPDLAIEVILPHDEVYEVERKIREYLGAGVRQVWIIIPATASVRIHSAGGIVELRDNQELSFEDLFPGWHTPVRALFDYPGTAQRQA